MLAGMKFGDSELVGLIVAVSFAAGLNVYATVATLGLLANAGLLDLPTGLHLITSWWVIAASGILFAIEFFADKIPAFDLFWNALHTFVRIPVAALIAYGATAQLSPEKQLLATLAGGAIALAAHGGLGFLQDGDVGVGVFPEGEEILVGGKRTNAGGIGIRSLRSSRLQSIGPSHSQMRQRSRPAVPTLLAGLSL